MPAARTEGWTRLRCCASPPANLWTRAAPSSSCKKADPLILDERPFGPLSSQESYDLPEIEEARVSMREELRFYLKRIQILGDILTANSIPISNYDS